jgi:hypothetical protein
MISASGSTAAGDIESHSIRSGAWEAEMDAVSKVLERLYAGFFLRDILGFVVPGAISLISLWFICGADSRLPKTPSNRLVTWFGGLDSGWQVVTFIMVSYILAWILQTLLYGLVNLIAKRRGLLEFFKGKLKGLVPFGDTSDVGQTATVLSDSWAMTRVSLRFDSILAKDLPREMLAERLEEFPYTERLSALAIMSSNLAISTFLVVVAMLLRFASELPWWAVVILAVVSVIVPSLLYMEYWRLIRARNLQIAIYAAAYKHPRSRPCRFRARRSSFRGAGGQRHTRA